MATLTSSCAQAWRWWRAELRAALPVWLFGMFRGTDAALVTLDADDQPSLMVGTSGSGRNDDLVLVIPERAVLCRPVCLPIAARRHLRSILLNDLDRLSPLKPEQVYVTYNLLVERRAEGRLEVELRLIQRQWLDQILAACALAGLSPTRMRYQDGLFASNGILPLLRPLSLGKRLIRMAIIILLVLLPLELTAAAWLEMERKQAALDELLTMVARARIEALATDRARAETAKIRTAFDRLVMEKQVNRPTDVLATLSETVASDSWAFSLTTEGGEARLSGFSQSASALLRAIEEAPAFKNAQFRSPVVRTGQDGMERFELSFQMVNSP